jgi:hypothetical protein
MVRRFLEVREAFGCPHQGQVDLLRLLRRSATLDCFGRSTLICGFVHMERCEKHEAHCCCSDPLDHRVGVVQHGVASMGSGEAPQTDPSGDSLRSTLDHLVGVNRNPGWCMAQPPFP